MFTFRNPNTPIIAHGTVVEHGGEQFTVKSGVLQYFYSVCNSAGEQVALVPMAGRSGCYDWAAGVALVEDAIKKAAA